MKVKTHLSLTRTARGTVFRQEEQERLRKQGSTFWQARLTRAEKRRVIKPTLPGAANRFAAQRAARVEALRAQVRAGTYEVDSSGLAREILAGLLHDAPGD